MWGLPAATHIFIHQSINFIARDSKTQNLDNLNPPVKICNELCGSFRFILFSHTQQFFPHASFF